MDLDCGHASGGQAEGVPFVALTAPTQPIDRPADPQLPMRDKRAWEHDCRLQHQVKARMRSQVCKPID
jgi:hypothetical protein